MNSPSPESISAYLLDTFSDVQKIETWGETSFFYNPGNLKPKGSYFCTIKEKDGPNDSACNLNREGLFRFNFSLTKERFLSLFEDIPTRPPKGGVIEGAYDFEMVDRLMPHPVYGWMCWVAILNPTNLAQLTPLLEECYHKIQTQHNRRMNR